MPKEPTVIDVHAKALDFLYEVEGIDPFAREEHLPATAATILYMLLKNEEEENNETV